jgi:hypothetical protein
MLTLRPVASQHLSHQVSKARYSCLKINDSIVKAFYYKDLSLMIFNEFHEIVFMGSYISAHNYLALKDLYLLVLFHIYTPKTHIILNICIT